MGSVYGTIALCQIPLDLNEPVRRVTLDVRRQSQTYPGRNFNQSA